MTLKGFSMPMRYVMILVMLLVAAMIVISLLQSQGANATSFTNNSVSNFP